MANSFQYSVPTMANGEALSIEVPIGECLFVVGPNGVGKSALLQRFDAAGGERSMRLSGHRMIWFQTSQVQMTAGVARNTEGSFRGYDKDPSSRWRDNTYSDNVRSNVYFFKLVEAVQVRARRIASAVDAGDLGLAQTVALEPSAIHKLNVLLHRSNLSIQVQQGEDGAIFASKDGSKPYDASMLSDGERSALLLLAAVLTCASGSVIIIDEPERHIHRSIAAPLMLSLIAERSDCSFIVATHDIALPIECGDSPVLLVRGCDMQEHGHVRAWDADLILSANHVDEGVRLSILCSRRKMVFVEGTHSSRDIPLYGLIFPNASIVSKESCRAVEQAVTGIRESADLHWIKAWGIVDEDRRSQEDADRLRKKGVHVVPAYSVESIYYHPVVQKMLAERVVKFMGGDVDEILGSAAGSLFEAIDRNAERLAGRAVEKRVRDEIMSFLPTSKDVQAGQKHVIEFDLGEKVAVELEAIKQALGDKSAETLISRYPIRETGALKGIAVAFGFPGHEQYESAVLTMLADEVDALSAVRGMFQGLYEEIMAA
ncbi:AAA family ATPase [Cupriavidus sp. SZY C1]|uniref:AAA family ATPase n=1 Tax=Cupriavidus sp. SZY C1 TaxID=3055037 RepID=UPI0028BA5171|nr:AAA family ATPase [Cupriavidus sp. SZY C1]MDT6960155.1 AAA family ATPase [Cupriavidus sp. SZY C1]